MAFEFTKLRDRVYVTVIAMAAVIVVMQCYSFYVKMTAGKAIESYFVTHWSMEADQTPIIMTLIGVVLSIAWSMLVPGCGWKAQRDGGLAGCYVCCTSVNICSNCIGIFLILLPFSALLVGVSELGQMCAP